MSVLAALVVLGSPGFALGETCDVRFTVEVTQGVGPFAPGTHLEGRAEYTTGGRSFRQEGGSTAYLASGRMALGDAIEGPIWTLIITANGVAADRIGIFARDVEGFDFAGIAFDGPMVLTAFGPSGARPDSGVPLTQEDWDLLTLRRSFSLHAEDADMLAGDVTELSADCR